MSKKEESTEEVSVEEILMSQAYAIQAIINVLEKKGILTREEIFDEIQAIEEEVGDCDCDCGCDCEDEESCDCGCDHEHVKASQK